MGFFDVPPLAEEDDDQLTELDEYTEGRWLSGALPVEQFVGWSEQAAVAVRRISVLPDSFEVEVAAWVRKPSRPRSGRYRHPFREIILAPHGPWAMREEDGRLPDSLVRFGVQFPDGGRATNLDLDQRWPDASDPQHGMTTQGGSSSRGEAEQRFSIWPMPASGDIVFVCEWPAYGIGESRLTISGDELRAAGARARPVWPDDLVPGQASPSSLPSQRTFARSHAMRRGATGFVAPVTEPAAASEPEPAVAAEPDGPPDQPSAG